MYLKKTALQILPILFLFGCSNTPQDSIITMYDSLRDGDFVTFTRYTKDPLSREISVNALGKCSVDKPSYKDGDFRLLDDCFKEMYKDIFVKKISIKMVTDTKAYAQVIVEKKQQDTTENFALAKIDYRWYVVKKN